MSSMSRFGPSVARSMLLQQYRCMASAVGSQTDPIQKLFLDKIKEFKIANKGLDETHQKMLSEEMKRLQRVFKQDDDSKLAKADCAFSSEVPISLHDLDTSKELREQVYSGEYQKRLAAETKPKSALLETIQHSEWTAYHLPHTNKPTTLPFYDMEFKAPPPRLGEPKADYESVCEEVTPESLERQLCVKFDDAMPTIDDDKSPERDLVNFPRPTIQMDTPPTVAHIIPYSWFKFFHPKTGVTGPYAFGVGFTTFLLSKEWLVVEHELLSGISLILLFSWLIPKFGPTVSSYFRKKVDDQCREWDNWQKGSIETLLKIRDSFKNELKKGEFLDELYSARKQDVEMQLEYEYRKRLNAVYEDTKRRLNYLVAIADSKRQINQTYMVNWLINSVNNSIGPKLEEDFLNSCIGNLKVLAQKNHQAI